MFSEVKEWVQSIKEKLRGHHRWKTFAYAGIVVTCLFLIWLTQTNQGWIARNSFMKTFETNRERVVIVYSADGEPVRKFIGTYNVEFFSDKYLVIMNQNTGERVNVYGSSVIVIDESPDYSHSIEEGEYTSQK